MSLKSVLERVDRLADRISKKLPVTQEEKDAQQAADYKAEDEAIAAGLEPVARRMLLHNLRASGIKRRSGQLEQAIAGAKVWIRRKRGNVELVIGFKTGVSPAKGTSVYRYGSALNYGAVHQPGKGDKTALNGATRVGHRRKKALKAKILNSLLKPVAPGKRIPYGAQVKGRRVHTSGGLIVIKPYHFFQLNPFQTRVIQTLYDKRSTELRAKRQAQQAA